MKSTRFFLLGLVALAAAVAGRAQFVVTGLNDLSTFSGMETVLDFTGVVNAAAITTDFASEGVTFGPGLFGLTMSGDTVLFPNNGDGVLASNWIYPQGSPSATTWTATFDVAQERVGFLVEMNAGDTLQLATSLAGISHGTVSRTSTATSAVFFGVQDLATFDVLTFTVTGSSNHFFAMDNFRFDAVPEPSALALVGIGLPLLAWTWRRRAAQVR